MKKATSRLPVLLFAILSVGCSQDATPDLSGTESPGPQIDGSRFLLDKEPEDAKGVIACRASAQTDDQVVVVGRIGGRKDPWIKGRAAFSIVDTSLLACNDREGDDCPIPWDYCCETDKLPTSTAHVKFVDSEGRVLEAGARDLFAVKELQTVVISGSAQRDDAENLTILAQSMFVRN